MTFAPTFAHEDNFDSGQCPVGRFDWERWVKRVTMPPGVKFLALMLATYSSKDGERVMPGVARLAAEMEVSHRTVIRGMQYLRSSGFVERTRQGNRYLNQVDEYRLTLPPDVLERVHLDPDGRPLT